ncbi:MAG: DUF2927 domain-containing protein [Pseudomonadota bacterium]
MTIGACDLLQPSGLQSSPPPQNRPADFTPPAPPPQQVAERSDASRQLSVHYQRVQNDLVARGLLRTDGGGPDTTFTDTILARNFVRIALFDEFVNTGAGLQARPTISRLRRWEQPVRFTVEFGASVPEDQRREDQMDVENYVGRLARITGHPMSMNAGNPNFRVLILNEDDRLGYEARLRALVPGIDDASVRAFMDVPRDTLCLVLAFSVGGASEYSQAVALIRGEHPDLMRLACIHEELAQGLGLANDSPRARPSIFNDDEEFGLLTTHDELLLQMLYDDRLQTGMAAAEAAPIARIIADEIMNGGPS